MAFSEQQIRDIRDRIDLVQLIARRVDLKKRGRNHVGLCPFHQEKTPSFNVSPERGSYYCFGCHASGDAFSFLQNIEGQTFPEAVRHLAQQAGVELDERPESPDERAARERRDQLVDVLQRVQQLYRKQLEGSAGQSARRYLDNRGLQAAEMERFGVGFGGQRQIDLVAALKGVDLEQLEAAGVVAQSERGPYHRFAERVTFVIRDRAGRVRGFGGRVFGPRAASQRAKYINSPESEVFHKSELLYGLHEARAQLARTHTVILVEGYLDVISLSCSDVGGPVAPCGTAMTEQQSRLLARHCKSVILAFDGDKAGQKAALRALPMLLAHGLEVRWAVLGEGEDPDSLARKDAAALTAILKDAPLALERLIDEQAREHGHSIEGRLLAVETLRAPLMALPVGLARDLFIERSASALSIERSALMRELSSRGGRVAARSVEVARSPEPAPRPRKIPQLERQIVRLFLEWPHLLDEALVDHLPDLLRSIEVKSFISTARSQRKSVQRSLTQDELVALLEHEALRAVAKELAAGQQVYAEANARTGLLETCENLWRTRAQKEKTQLMHELESLAEDPSHAEAQHQLLKKIRDLNVQLGQGCPWLLQDESGTQAAATRT